MQDFITRQRLDERSRLELTFTYADNTRVVVSTRAEGALHDLNYPEMHRAKERKPFNRMSQSKNPLAQPLIYTSSASEATGTADSIHTFACPPLIRSLSFHPCVKVACRETNETLTRLVYFRLQAIMNKLRIVDELLENVETRERRRMTRETV